MFLFPVSQLVDEVFTHQDQMARWQFHQSVLCQKSLTILQLFIFLAFNHKTCLVKLTSGWRTVALSLKKKMAMPDIRSDRLGFRDGAEIRVVTKTSPSTGADLI